MIESFCEPINCFLLKNSLAEQTGEARHMIERFVSARGASLLRETWGCVLQRRLKNCAVWNAI